MKLNILVVDDETPICEWLVYCIRKASPDYVVQAANNGEEAYEKILHWKPDVVFTDIRMPGMDGLELMKAILEVLPFTTFAILTNYAEFTYAKQAVSLGAKEYFLKSELRAADLEKLLQEVMESKVKVRTSKVNDVYRDVALTCIISTRPRSIPVMRTGFGKSMVCGRMRPIKFFVSPPEEAWSSGER